MSLNKQTLKILDISEEDYLKWCKKNHKPSYKTESKEKFIKEIMKEKDKK